MKYRISFGNRLPLLTLAATLQCVPDAHWRLDTTTGDAGAGGIQGLSGAATDGASAGRWNEHQAGRATTDLGVTAGAGNRIREPPAIGAGTNAAAGANSTNVAPLSGGTSNVTLGGSGGASRTVGNSGAGNAGSGGNVPRTAGGSMTTGGDRGASGGHNAEGGTVASTTNATGGNATTSNATGGNATTSNATGGNATGGNATGGNATATVCTGSVQFTATGAAVPFLVPSCATHIKVDAYGAEGGTAFNLSGDNPVGGRGAYLSAVIAVTGGETLYAFVGGRGGDGTRYFGGDGGWNGGGVGGYADGGNWVGAAAGGGGATDLRRGGVGLDARIITAAGGGGASGACSSGVRPAGGEGGIEVGAMGGICLSASTSYGYGGTQTSGGYGGDYNDCVSEAGEYGFGGNACTSAGGGGGGGYYGGGAGAWGGGGGGSSHVIASATNVTGLAGQHLGAGLLVISW
ncbi:MAG TPA: glycine rich domain-containing protein [Polyangiaceae bacterium]